VLEANGIMNSQSLGFVGIGRMGARMAARLLDAGYTLSVFDTSADALRPLLDRGARAASSPADVASQAPVVLMSLPTPAIVQAVTLGEGGIARGSAVKTVIDLSTTGPSAAAAIAQQLLARQISWADAPVSGGMRGASAGTLAIALSCPGSVRAEVEAILKNLGKTFYVGEKAGLGQVVKLANNLLGAAALAVSSEAMVMGVKAGVDPQIMLDAINAGTGRNSATVDKFPRAILTRTFDFGFSTGLSYKDVKLCIDEAEALGVPMVVGAVVRQMLAITNAKFGPDSDFTSIARVVEEWGGIEIRGAANTVIVPI
jgi:3-hydroxyisobutyrate dehydrogenase-like beta-hydroxyacid dehydrogenase